MSLDHSDLISAPIQFGDAGIIIKTNGTFELFNCYGLESGVTVNDRQMETSLKLIALCYALKTDAVMDNLLKEAAAAGFFDEMKKPKLQS